MFDISKLGQPTGTSGFRFGMTQDGAVAMLEEFLAQVKGGKIALQGVEQSTTATPDDFMLRSLTLKYAEKDDTQTTA